MATLVVLAAGVGSRYGKGVKQLAPIGPKGETLMEYSVRDAMAAGFDKAVFIVNVSIYREFSKTVLPRMRAMGMWCDVVLQAIPVYRRKPMGTGQAIMLCRDYISEPFAIINADDYYGKEAYEKAYEYLYGDEHGERYGTIGYSLRNTLSSNGPVTRGVCEMDNAGRLVRIRETKNITMEGGACQGLNGDEIVVVNFWLLPPSFVDRAARGYEQFIQRSDHVNDEYLLPDIVDEMIRKDNVAVDVIRTNARCYGMTYASDVEYVKRNVCEK